MLNCKQQTVCVPAQEQAQPGMHPKHPPTSAGQVTTIGPSAGVPASGVAH
jgi:hypothetical protein